MSRLILIAPSSAEGALAPEFRYLASWMELQAREVYDSVERVESLERESSQEVDVLLLPSERTLVGAESLRRMRQCLEAGGENRAVSARALGSIGRGGESDAVYTLRGYERFEARHLGSSSEEKADRPGPVVLVREATLRGVLEGRELAEAWPPVAGGPMERIDWRLRGLFHEFIDYYGELRDDVVPLIPEGTESILEVGCGRGTTARYLQERFGCRVTGVELNPVVAREAARHLHDVKVGDVAELELQGEFDAVLALELFEHLVNAEAVLASLGRLVRPGGRIVLSVPNVGHYSVVEDLLAGRWDYLPIGLLCYTHYRFFTGRTLAEWIRRSGYEDFELLPQKTALPESWAEPIDRFETDLESLATKGFYVVITVG